ncbi:endonuclease III [Candidatus Peregrinibacteria bacterium]|nr:endonuclease III [Candidatus Peregrinibacteria bacterium]
MASVKKILSLLEKKYGNSETALDYETPVQMLVSTILSAQCTDERVNKVTPVLYAKYDTAEDYANADKHELEQIIRSTGFYKNKAKNIIGACKMIVDKYDGKVPKTMDEMLTLPGVARKTANVVLGNAYGIVEGIVVDTHVGRLARRFGFSSAKDTNKVEKDLMKIVPRSKWNDIAYWLIDHGRALCKSQKPKCADCFLKIYCPSAGRFDAKGKWIGPK